MAMDIFDKNYAIALSNFLLDNMFLQRVSKETMAEKVGVKYNTLCRYLSASRQMPIDLFAEMCKVLNLDFEDSFRKINEIAIRATMAHFKDENVNNVS